jgi:hypothetical protein
MRSRSLALLSALPSPKSPAPLPPEADGPALRNPACPTRGRRNRNYRPAPAQLTPLPRHRHRSLLPGQNPGTHPWGVPGPPLRPPRQPLPGGGGKRVFGEGSPRSQTPPPSPEPTPPLHPPPHKWEVASPNRHNRPASARQISGGKFFNRPLPSGMAAPGRPAPLPPGRRPQGSPGPSPVTREVPGAEPCRARREHLPPVSLKPSPVPHPWEPAPLLSAVPRRALWPGVSIGPGGNGWPVPKERARTSCG